MKRRLMSEIKTRLHEINDEDGSGGPHYVITQHHTIADVLRHLVTELGDDDWDHLIDLCKLLKQDRKMT